jgi:glutamate/tyrosine decarboxylase-like PLP-dependent enzyme
VPAYLRNNSSGSESKGDGRTDDHCVALCTSSAFAGLEKLASVVCFISSSLSVVMSSLAAVAEARRRRNGERSSLS